MKVDERTWYEEKLSMRSPWVVPLIVASCLISTVIIAIVLISDNQQWELITGVVAFSLVMNLLIIYMVRSLRLYIALSRAGIHLRMSPVMFRTRLIQWTEVKEIRLVRSPFPGYSIRMAPGYKVMYLMSGKQSPMGLEVHFHQGRKIFFSTAKPEELLNMIRTKNININLITA